MKPFVVIIIVTAPTAQDPTVIFDGNEVRKFGVFRSTHNFCAQGEQRQCNQSKTNSQHSSRNSYYDAMKKFGNHYKQEKHEV